MVDPNLSGQLVALVRARVKLRTVEAPAAVAGLVSVSATLAEPACAHAVTAALAVGSRSRLEVPARVLSEPRRRAWRIAAAVAAGWVVVWAGLGWVSQQRGLSVKEELAATEARIAQTESALAGLEAADDFNPAQARERFAVLAEPRAGLGPVSALG